MRYIKTILGAFDGSDIPIAVFCAGLILIAYGASRIHDGLGAVSVGIILILYVKPLARWLK